MSFDIEKGIKLKMSKYLNLWKYIEKSNKEILLMSFDDVASILGFNIDHSFLSYKKELESFGTRYSKYH